MLSVAEARAAIRAALPLWPAERVPLAAARGRVLRQPVVAERDQPPFDRVTMDGIAIAYAAFAAGRRDFAIAGTQHAGDPAQALPDAGTCIEIMTGAVLPAGCDCVVPVERVTVANGVAQVDAGYAAECRQFVHARGSDHAGGTGLLAPGRRIGAIDVALLASAGLADVEVTTLPCVRIISTGNELVAPGEAIADHQVRMSNGPALCAMLRAQGYDDAAHAHLADDPASMAARIEELLQEADVLVLSGGVSMGQADFVPGVLEGSGVRRAFHRIAQRPGKPMWFGSGPRGQLVFALPGNPVSALTCCRHYVLPALLEASGGMPRPPAQAVLASAYTFRPDLTCFLPVRIVADPAGRLLAEPAPTNTSGDFTALAVTDGYLELAREQSEFAAGSVQPLYAWDRP